MMNELKKRRLELGLTQEQLAQKIGVTWSTISRWEKNDRIPTSERTRAMLQECLGLDVVQTRRFIRLPKKVGGSNE